MLQLFFIIIPDFVKNFISEQMLRANPEYIMPTALAIVLHILTAVISASLGVLLVYGGFKLLQHAWRKILKPTRLGRYLEKELLPIFWGMDWWLCLLVCFSAEIIIEYQQVFRGLAHREFKPFLFSLFSGLEDNTNLRSVLHMFTSYGVAIVFHMLIPLGLLVGRHIATGDKYYTKYTFSFGNWKPGLFLMIGCWIIMLVVLYFAMGFNDRLANLYPMVGDKNFIKDVPLFIIFELGALLYFMSFEYFFRGPLYFEFEKKIGAYAILIMILPYVIIKFGKPTIEIISAIIAGLVFCIFARWTRTFIWGALLHFIVALSADIMGSLYQLGLITFPFR